MSTKPGDLHIAVLGLSVGLVGAAFHRNVENSRPVLAGDYTRETHTLRVEPGWIVLDNKLRLPIGETSVKDTWQAEFHDAILAKGLMLDDKCSGSLERREQKMIVSMSAGSHGDCNAFAGEWIAKGTPEAKPITAGATVVPKDASLCGRVSGRWVADAKAATGWNWGAGSPHKLLAVDGRTVKVTAILSNGELAGEGWIGWNTKAPTEEGGACVFQVREAIEGEGFRLGPDGDLGASLGEKVENPYAAVTKLKIVPQGDGVEFSIETDDPSKLPCVDKTKCKDGHFPQKAIETMKGWFKSLDGSFWKPAPPEVAKPKENSAPTANAPEEPTPSTGGQEEEGDEPK